MLHHRDSRHGYAWPYRLPFTQKLGVAGALEVAHNRAQTLNMAARKIAIPLTGGITVYYEH